MRASGVRDFYESGQGDRLIDPKFYPEEIKRFLSGERHLLNSLNHSFDALIEVGCMHGRYLNWALEQDKIYIGIDIVPRYIKLGRQRIRKIGLSPRRFQFKIGGAEKIHSLVNPGRLRVRPRRCILFFPFNSFGNVLDIVPVIVSIRKSKLPFLICSYQTTEAASACRLEYYIRCGYKEICRHIDEKGVYFLSQDGLRSVAYHPQYTRKIFRAHELSVRISPFSMLGLAYYDERINLPQKKNK